MILEEETFSKFGYYPKTLKSKSRKRILVKYDKCDKIREIRMDAYRGLCKSCAQLDIFPSNESIKRMSKSHMGNSISASTRKKIGDSLRKKYIDTPHPSRKKHRSKETCEKISNSSKGRTYSDEMREKYFKCRPRGDEHYNWKGGTSKTFLYSKNGFTSKLKEMVRERDKYICQYCGKMPALDIHHIIPFRINKDNSLLNLITLCRSCHIYIEYLTDRILKENENPMKIFYQKWST